MSAVPGLRRRIAGLSAALAACAAAAAPATATVSPTLAESGRTLAVEQFAIAMNPAGDRSALVYGGAVAGTRRRALRLRARVGHGRSFTASSLLESMRRGTGSRAQISITDVTVAVGRDGTAVAAWVASTFRRDYGHPRRRLRIASATPRGRFGRARTLLVASGRSLEIDALVVGRGGLAVLALQRDDAVEMLVGRARGRFGARQPIGTSAIFAAPPTLALAPGGAVVAAWS
ncbi:MAG: hypothetical protein ACRDMZ_06780, partial [Solirubrobacteraceae bacterium]